MKKNFIICLSLLLGSISSARASALIGDWICPEIGSQTIIKILPDGSFSKSSTNPNIIPWSGRWKQHSQSRVTFSIPERTSNGVNLGGYEMDYTIKFAANKMSLLVRAGASFENCLRTPTNTASTNAKEQVIEKPKNTVFKKSNPFAIEIYQFSDAAVSIDPRSIEIKNGTLDLILTYDFEKVKPNVFGSGMAAQHVQMHRQLDCNKRRMKLFRITSTTADSKAIEYATYEPTWTPIESDDDLIKEACAQAPIIYRDHLELQQNATCVGVCAATRQSGEIIRQTTAQRCQALRGVASPLELARAGCR